MKSYILEYLQSVLANAPTFEEMRPELEKAAPKIVEGILMALFMGLVFLGAAKLRKKQAVREDGWYYLTPGFLSWFALLGTSLMSLGTLIGAGIALRIGYYKPTFEGKGLGQIGLFSFFILGFGALAWLSYVFFFGHKVRWNHTVIEKIVGRRMTARIAWKNVREIRQEKGADYLWIVSDKTRIKVWTHMNGVEQLIAAVNGDEAAFGLLRQIRPAIEAKPRPDHAGNFHPDHR